jgi:serine acetyltransferase
MTVHDRTAESAVLEKMLRAGQNVEHLQTLRTRKDGTVFSVILSLAPIRDAAGAIVAICTISHPVTEQKESHRQHRCCRRARLLDRRFAHIAPGARVLGGARVGNGTLVGSGAVVLPGVVIGAHVVVGASAVVRSNVSDGSVVVGVPGRRVSR